MPEMTLPARLRPLIEKPKRFKILIGGRGSGKSQSVGDIFLMDAQTKGLKTACFREYQITMDDSVLSLLSGEIERLKLSGFTDYYYRIAKGDGFPLDEAVFWHKGRTWQMSDRERMRRFQLRDIAIHLDAFVRSPLYVELSSYEAGRVMQLHAQIAEDEGRALEVWEALPNTVKMCLLGKGAEYAN